MGLQDVMADRMSANVEEVDGSHTAFVARPAHAAALIKAGWTEA